MKQIPLLNVRPGDVFRRKVVAKTTFVKGDYIRAEKRTECQDWNDANRYIYLHPKTPVWVGFDW